MPLQKCCKCREERSCRFCGNDYPDWREALLPAGPPLPTVTPVMAVTIGEELHKWVLPALPPPPLPHPTPTLYTHPYLHSSFAMALWHHIQHQWQHALVTAYVLFVTSPVHLCTGQRDRGGGTCPRNVITCSGDKMSCCPCAPCCYRVRIDPGPEGRERFRAEVAALLGYTPDQEFDVVFDCRAPHTGVCVCVYIAVYSVWTRSQ